MPVRPVGPVAALLVAGALLGLVRAPSTGASPVDDKRAEAARIQRQIEANGHRIAALGEQYNGALFEYNRTTAGIADARRRFDEAQDQVDAKRALLQRRAANLYTGASADNPLRAVDVQDVGELARRSKYGAAASEVDNGVISDLKVAQERLEEERKALEIEQATARRRRDAAAATKRQIEQANADQVQLLRQVRGELARLVDQERRRREAAAAAAARAAVTPRSTRSAPSGVDAASVGGGFVGPIPTSSGVAAVIAYARAQLGKPYVFATAGPNTFDCSGLKKMAWAQAGVSMAHFSGAQFNAFPHVPVTALQPGDLVFKGPGGRDHVALYIGGGMQIAATHTGDYVRLQPLSQNLSGAVRPG
jgi:cell wall-associated NlpC family hydrolase